MHVIYFGNHPGNRKRRNRKSYAIIVRSWPLVSDPIDLQKNLINSFLKLPSQWKIEGSLCLLDFIPLSFIPLTYELRLHLYAYQACATHTKASEKLWSWKWDVRGGAVKLKCTKLFRPCAELVVLLAATLGGWDDRIWSVSEEVANTSHPCHSLLVVLGEELPSSFLMWVLAVLRKCTFWSILSALGFPAQHPPLTAP